MPSIPIGNVSATAVYYGYYKVWPASDINTNCFYYVTNDNQPIVLNYDDYNFNGIPNSEMIISHTYTDKGIITCASPITRITNGDIIYNNSNRTRYISVILPNTLTGLSNYFENCTNLVSINIPDAVTTISARAFAGCRSLKNIMLPPSLEKINSYAFYETDITYFSIPSTVTKVFITSFGAKLYKETKVLFPNHTSVPQLAISSTESGSGPGIDLNVKYYVPDSLYNT